MSRTCLSARFARNAMGVLVGGFLAAGAFVPQATAQVPLSQLPGAPLFTPNGDIAEFVTIPAGNADQRQEYFLISGGQAGKIKNAAVVAPGIFQSIDFSPQPGPGVANPAGPTGFRDLPGFFLQQEPTGFNIGRIFVSYNPNLQGGTYFIAIDNSAPVAMDTRSNTQPIAFDVDGDTSIVTSTEVDTTATGCGTAFTDAPPAALRFADNYTVSLDLDRDGFDDIFVQVFEVANLAGQAAPVIPANARFISLANQDITVVAPAIQPPTYTIPRPGGGSFNVYRVVLIDSIASALLNPTRFFNQHMRFDSDNNGSADSVGVGVGADVEFMITHVNPSSLDPALDQDDPFRVIGGNRCCVTFLATCDTDQDECIGGGAEEAVELSAQFACPDIEVSKLVRCVDPGASKAGPSVQALQGSILEFSISITNYGNIDLSNVRITSDVLQCVNGATLTLVPGSFSYVGTRPSGIRDFGTDFFNALANPALFPLSLDNLADPNPGLNAAPPGPDGCSSPPGESVTFQFRAQVGSAFDQRFCNTTTDCSNTIAVAGDAVVSTIPPSDFENNAARVTPVTVIDNAATSTPRETGPTGEDFGDSVTIDVRCRQITLVKEVGFFGNAASFVTGDNPLRIAPFAGSQDIEYHYTVRNNGDLTENITLNDANLCADIAATPGVSIVSCAVVPAEPACTLCPSGSIVASFAPGQQRQYQLRVRFANQAALEAFLLRDDARVNCRASTTTGSQADGYKNCATISGTLAPGAVVCGPAGTLTDADEATIRIVRCSTSVVKDVRCLRGTDTTFRDSVAALPGESVQFRIRITNTGASASDTICAIEITDLLQTLAGTNCLGAATNVRFDINGTVCTTPAAFNTTGTAFTFTPCAHGGAPPLNVLRQGEVLTITFDVPIPTNAAAACSMRNTVTVRCASTCEPTPAFCCTQTDTADVSVLVPNITCTKAYTTFQWDENGDCALTGADPIRNFTNPLTDLINFNATNMAVVFPVLVNLRITGNNTGETSLVNVTASDPNLVADINTPPIPGVTIVSSQLGQTRTIAPAGNATWDVSIRFDSAAAARLFATRDDARVACRNTAANTYRNCATVSGNVDVPDGVCEPPTPLTVNSTCQAEIAFPGPCTLTVTKQVKCSTAADGTFAASVTTIPGAIVTYKIDITNAGTVKIPRLCLRDQLPCNWPVVGNVTGFIGALDVSSVLRAAGNAFAPDNVQRCYSFETVRPAAPWLAPGETLSIRFNVQSPADDNAFPPNGANSDCRNTIFADGFAEKCVPAGVPDTASCSGSAFADVSILVPRIECDKETCVDLNNDGDCNDPGDVAFGSTQNMPCNISFPFTLLYRFTIANTGETQLDNVRIRDLELVNDARNIPGVTIVSCGLCTGACDGTNDTDAVFVSIPAGQIREAQCRIRFDTRAAWQTFATRDVATSTPDNDLNCYTNTATATGTAAGLCTAGANAERTSQPCTSTVCLKICDLQVTKQVRCLDQCQQPADPEAGWLDELTVAPNACVEYRIIAENTSQTAVSICSLRIRDVLDQTCVKFDDNVSITIIRAGGGASTPCFVPANLNDLVNSPLATNSAFEFVPGSCTGGPPGNPLQPGDRLVLKFRAKAQQPAGNPARCTATNTATVEGATVCGGPTTTYCCSTSDQAIVHVESCSFNLTKSVVCLDQAGNPTGPEGPFLAALRGAKARFTFRITNTSPALNFTRLCISDSMSCSWARSNVRASIGATDVTATFGSFAADGVRRCYDLSARPLAPNETLAISFDVQIPADFDTVCTPVDCVNSVTVEATTNLCIPPGQTDSICGTHTATASIDVRVPRVVCEKRVTVQNNDGSAPISGTDVNVDAPVFGNTGIPITYTIIVRNIGDVPLSNVRVCDAGLVEDAHAAGLQITNCQFCDVAGCDGVNDTCAVIPLLLPCGSPCEPLGCPSAQLICQITVQDEAHWLDFASRDGDTVPTCYFNSVQVTATPNSDGLCAPPVIDDITSQACEARVCMGRTFCPCPPIVKAKFDIWNQNEARFSGVERCLNAWDSTLFSAYLDPSIPNALTLAILQTVKGKARIDGIASSVVCGPNSISAPLLGVAERLLTFETGARESSGETLVGMGSEFGQIIWKRPPLPNDPQPPPPPPGGQIPDESGEPVPSLAVRVGQVSQQGSLLVYPKVVVRTNAQNQVIEDTFIEISNNWTASTRIQMYFVNGNPCRCNWLDNQITLTQNEATYWAASSGDPKGVSPWRALDGLGEADTDPANPGGRLWRGWIVAWAVDSAGIERRWNFLSGVALNVKYNSASAWQYLPWAFQAIAGANTGDPLLLPYAQLDLDGREYEYAPDQLLLDFFASGGHPYRGRGAGISIDTELTLMPLLRSFQTNDPPPEEARQNPESNLITPQRATTPMKREPVLERP